MWSLSSSSRLLLSSSWYFTVVAADSSPSLELYIPSIAIAMWEQTPIDSIQTATCSGLVDIHFIPGGHVRLRVFKLLVGKCTHTRWNYCSRKYGDGHLNKVSILKNGKVMSILQITSSYIWRPFWFSNCGGRWEYFTILFEILTVENVGIDTKTKSLDSLIRKIFVIAWFHLISMLIRSIRHKSTWKHFLLRSSLLKMWV